MAPGGCRVGRGRVKPLDGFYQLNGEVESGVRGESVCGYDMVCYKFVISFMEHASSEPLASMQVLAQLL
jgi:hypothetical protein